MGGFTMSFKRLFGILAVILVMAVLVPASQAQAYCYGALPPRLQVGGQGQVTPGLPNIFRTQPYRGYDSIVLGEIPASGVFSILGGPSCYEGMYWWQVNYNGRVGWTPEASNSGVYWTEPVTSGGCMPLPSRLIAGQNGRVLPGLPNTLRSQPYVGYDSQVLLQIPAGSIFNVIAGPNCSDGMTWWMVSYNGYTGYTPEGQYGTYWLEPYGQVIVTPPPAGCPQYLTPYMIPGYTGIVTPGAPNNLRSQASLNGAVIASMAAGETFSVLSGPLCVAGINWWQVNYRGTVGWTAEGQNGRQWVEALNCPGFMPSRVSVGKYARISPGLPNRLRSSASTAAYVLALIPGGATVTVVGGPVCGENAVWWRVNYNGRIGWTMEGQGSQYWIDATT
jgi:uncharacterized protein YraI